MHNIIVLVAFGLIAGCSGKLYTIVNPNISKTNEEKIQGVISYNSINVVEQYKTTVLVDKASGNQLGSAPDNCTPQKSIKYSTRTDYSNPNIIVYEPGILETSKFGVTLEKGVLTGVNTESNPSAALAGIAAVLPFVSAPVTASNTSEFLANDGKPLCNAGPKLVGVFHAPDIQPFDNMEQ